MTRPCRRACVGLFCLFLLLTLCAFPYTAAAQPQSAAARTPAAPMDIGRLRVAANQEWHSGELPHATSAAPMARPALKPQAPSATVDWTEVVFQAWVDNSYEIYSSKIDGTGLKRLTDNPANDGRARINRGGTAIAFSSNRDGDFEIFRMDLDGASIRQLTQNSAIDAKPAWSYAGNKIAYISDESGSFGLYTMNADGSGKILLAVSAYGDIFDPAWAPDGSQIVFCFEPAGEPENRMMMVIGSDGSNLHAIGRSTYPYLQNIVVDKNATVYFDFAESGWSRIYHSPINAGPNEYYKADMYASEGQDIWMGAPTPDKYGYFSYVQVNYQVVDQQWQMVSANVNIFCSQGFVCAWVNSPSAYSFYPDWQSLDVTPPVTQITPLPAYSRSQYISVYWNQLFPGPSPVQYEYAYKISPSGNWSIVPLSTSPANPFVFNSYAHPGEQVFFKMHATDEAGNQENWPTNPDYTTSTIIYTYQLNGRVTDNRGKALTGQAVEVTPVAVNNLLVTGKDGQFQAYLQNLGLHTLNAHPTGLGPLPATQAYAAADVQQDLHFTAGDNLVENSGFEAPLGNEWTLAGSLPSGQRSQSAYSGQSGLALGCANAFCDQAEATPAYGDKVEMAVDSAGGVHILAARIGDGVYASSRSPQGLWSGKVLVFDTHDAPAEIYIHCDDQNRVHALARFQYYILYAYKTATGTWSAPVKLDIGRIVSGSDNDNRSFAVDRGGKVYALAVRHEPDGLDHSELLWLSVDGTGQWQKFVDVGQYSDAQITVDADGAVYVLRGSLLQKFSSQGAAVSSENVGAPDSTGYAQTLQLSPAGVHVILYYSNSLYYFRSPAGDWSYTQRLPQFYEYGHFAIASQGALIYFYQAYNQSGTSYTAFDPTTGWLPLVDLDRNVIAVANRPSDNGIFLLTRQGSDSFAPISLENFNSPRPAATSQIEQTVTLDGSLHAPTLSLMARFVNEAGGSSYDIDILDGETTTRLFSTIAGHTWTQRWFPLDDWAGKTIRLRITLHQAEGEIGARLDLDDISVGSWRTPSLSAVEPSRIYRVADNPVLTIHGDNFIATPDVWIDGVQIAAASVHWVDGATLTVNLPASLLPGHHSVKLANSGSVSATLDPAFTSGYSAYVPILTRQ
jgi:hypothetical protein